MTDREFELWTGSEMVSSGLEFRLETGPVTGLAELAYYPSLGLDPNWVSYGYRVTLIYLRVTRAVGD